MADGFGSLSPGGRGIRDDGCGGDRAGSGSAAVARAVGSRENGVAVAEVDESVLPEKLAAFRVEAEQVASDMGEDPAIFHEDVGETATFQVGAPVLLAALLVETDDVAANTEIEVVIHEGTVGSWRRGDHYNRGIGFEERPRSVRRLDGRERVRGNACEKQVKNLQFESKMPGLCHEPFLLRA